MADLGRQPRFMLNLRFMTIRFGLRRWILLAGAVFGTAMAVWTSGCSRSQPLQTMRAAMVLTSGQSLGGSPWQYPEVAIAPDGAHVVFAATEEGMTQLYIRDVASDYARQMVGTGDAHTPVFSPDGKWIAAIMGG